MRLFFYYALHSLFNQLRKLFKTWVLVMIIVCGLIGGLIGFGAASLQEAAESQPTEQIEEVIEEAQDEVSEEITISASIGLETVQIFELAAGAVILLVLTFEIFSAEKNAGKIFLPADVNLLFASPMPPQSVLMFRLATQLGTAVAGSIYLLFQIPNLMLNLGVSLWAALSVIAAWCLTLITGKLLQMSVYVISSVNPFIKKNLHRIIYVFFALLLGAFYLYSRSFDGTWIQAAYSFFSAPLTRWIPFWGWIRMFTVSAVKGSAMAFVYLALLFAGCGLLAWLIWNIRTDFYEDALIKAQEVAELMEAVQSERGGLFVQRKKARSERIRRDGFEYGSGANVYFFKPLYNRFRFGHLRFFTKTSETYLIACILMAVLLRFIISTESVMPMVFMLCGLAFLRTLGNPLNEDEKLDYFRLIPEKTWKKLFFSLAGGSVNCLLDVLAGLIAGSLIMGVNPLTALAWIPLIISVDFYATNIGTFLDLSIPSSIGRTFKQTMQILFIYFGLLPDIAVIVTGAALNHPVLASVICALVNLYLGLLFMGLSAVFVEPYGGRDIETDGTETLDPSAKKRYSLLGFAGALILAVTVILQYLAGSLLGGISTDLAPDQWPLWLVIFLPMYLIAIPAGLAVMKSVPAVNIEEKKLELKYWIILPVISVFLMYAGNLAGMLVTSVLSRLFHTAQSGTLNLLSGEGTLLQRILFMVILAPLIEEYVFRRQLIERMHVYGGRTAVLVSAFMFGLFHGNFTQFFYAAMLGIVFGYVYLKTGRLRYTVALHMFVNFIGGVLGPQIIARVMSILQNLPDLLILSPAKLLALPQVYVFIIYIIVIFAMVLAGFVLLVQQMREISFAKEEKQLPAKSVWKTACLNPGMLCFIAGCIAMIVYSLI